MYELNGIMYAGTPEPIIKVRSVRPLDDYILLVTFTNGEKKKFDFKPLLELPCYRSLKNTETFRDVYIEYGTAVWNDETDIAPETLYQDGIPVSDAETA